MAQTPEELRQQIEQSRRNVGDDIDLLNEKVNPTRVVHRKMGRARGAMSSLRESVMGSASSTSDRTGSAASSAAGTVSAGQDTLVRKTEGNPIAAGLVAFGAGWLVSSVLPATRTEERAARGIQDKAQEYAEPVKQEVSQVATEIKDNLQPKAEEAAASVRYTASDSADIVRAEAETQGQEVAGQAQDSAETIRQSRGQ